MRVIWHANMHITKEEIIVIISHILNKQNTNNNNNINKTNELKECFFLAQYCIIVYHIIGKLLPEGNS